MGTSFIAHRAILGVVMLVAPAASAQEKATLRGHNKPVTSVAFSTDGKTLAVGT